MGIVAGISRDAVARGDLCLPEGLSAEDVIFGFWSITYGSQILSASSPSLSALGIVNPVAAIRQHCFTLLNGFHWQPIMDYSYHAELTNQEILRLKASFGKELI